MIVLQILIIVIYWLASIC